MERLIQTSSKIRKWWLTRIRGYVVVGTRDVIVRRRITGAGFRTVWTLDRPVDADQSDRER